MKLFCTKCGKKIKDGAKFCTNCGTPVKTKKTTIDEKVSVDATVEKQMVKSEQPVNDNVKKTEPKTKIFALVIVVVVIAVVGAVFWFNGGQDYLLGSKDDDKQTIEQEVKEETNNLTESDSEIESNSEEVTDSEDNEIEEKATEQTDKTETTEETEIAEETEKNVVQNELLEEFGIYEDTVENYENNLNPDYYKSYDSGIADFKFSYPAAMFNNVTKDTDAFEADYGTNVETISFSGSKGTEFIF